MITCDHDSNTLSLHSVSLCCIFNMPSCTALHSLIATSTVYSNEFTHPTSFNHLLQYFSTVGAVSELEDLSAIPWLPLSVICPPLALTVNLPEDEQSHTHTDEEAALNILLGKLGPSEDGAKGQRSKFITIVRLAII